MSDESSKALHDRQRHYDELHHLMRLEWLECESPKYDDGTPIPKFEILTLKNGSTSCLDLIRKHRMATNSVDVTDSEYIAELDNFGASKS